MCTPTCSHTHFSVPSRRLRPIAVNAYVLVLVVDPVSAEGMAFADLILQMWQGMYPLRMGG